MLKKVPSLLFYLSILLLIFVFVCYVVEWIEIIVLINYTLYLFAILSFLLIWSISTKLNKTLRWTSFGIGLLGTSFWLIALLKIVDFETHWNWSFSLIILGLLLAIYGITSNNTKPALNLLNLCGLLFLFVCIYLTGVSYFEGYTLLFSALSAYSIISLLSHFIKQKEVK